MFDGLTIAQKLMYLEEHARQGGYTQTAEALRKLQECRASTSLSCADNQVGRF
jgi:hypothetical protein